jgi:ATP-dependent Clp protease ATP-binding subunit ClpC
LAEEIISAKIQEGDTITMDLDAKSNELKIKIKSSSKTTES